MYSAGGGLGQLHLYDQSWSTCFEPDALKTSHQGRTRRERHSSSALTKTDFASPMISTSKELNASALARLFSQSVLAELANNGQSPLFASLLKESGLLERLGPHDSVGSVFDTALEILKHKKYRHEYVYKAAIAEKILLGRHSLRTTTMLTEFRVDSCKADVVMLNGSATAYEIKSERDSLRRLEDQVSAYRKVFANVNVIAGENHIDDIMLIVPSDVGILRLTSRGAIRTLRRPIACPSRTQPARVLDSVSLVEAKLILGLLGKTVPQVPNTEIHSVLVRIFGNLRAIDVHSAMVSILRRTRSLGEFENLLQDVPKSLVSAILTSRAKATGRLNIKQAIATPVNGAIQWVSLG